MSIGKRTLPALRFVNPRDLSHAQARQATTRELRTHWLRELKLCPSVSGRPATFLRSRRQANEAGAALAIAGGAGCMALHLHALKVASGAMHFKSCQKVRDNTLL